MDKSYLLQERITTLAQDLVALAGEDIDIPKDLKDLRLFNIYHHCVECDHIVDTQTVTLDRFLRIVDHCNAEIDREGDTEFSPVVKTIEIHKYDQACQSCKDYYADMNY